MDQGEKSWNVYDRTGTEQCSVFNERRSAFRNLFDLEHVWYCLNTLFGPSFCVHYDLLCSVICSVFVLMWSVLCSALVCSELCSARLSFFLMCSQICLVLGVLSSSVFVSREALMVRRFDFVRCFVQQFLNSRADVRIDVW